MKTITIALLSYIVFNITGCNHQPERATPRTIAAASVEYNDVTMAVQQASDGDTVTIPAGTANWNAQLKVTKGITLKGQTTVTGGGTKNASANDQTIIVDEGAASPDVIAFNTSQPFRCSGITLRGGANKPSGSSHAAVGLYPQAGQPYRLDNMHFALLNRRAVWIAGWPSGGVADNILMNCQNHNQSFYFEAGLWNNKDMGHGAWADYPWFGSNKFAFVEDTSIFGMENQSTGHVDNMNGARFVMRHCYFWNATVSGHGTESGPQRGNRAAEVYDCTFDWTTTEPAQGRSGTFIWHDNNWITKAGKNSPGTCYVLKVYREIYRAKYWQYAQGTNPWDDNDTEGNDTFVEGNKSHLFDSGIATTNCGKQQGNTIIFEDSNKHWVPHQWAGYSVTNVTTFPYPHYGMWIVDNTENAIIYVSNWASDVQEIDWVTFKIGDAYEIHRVVSALDQSGKGKGDLLANHNGEYPFNTLTNTQSNPHQQQEICFAWNNVLTPTGEELKLKGSNTIREGRDFINLDKQEADIIPAAVKDIYNATRNGVDYTKEYDYPHPLRAGGLPTPSPITPTPAPSIAPTITPAPSSTPAPTSSPSSGLPAAPSDLAAHQGVTLTWQDNATNETGYQISRSDMDAKGNCVQFAALVSHLPVGATSYTDDTAQHGKSYCYRVRAEGKSGNYSGFTEIVKVTVP